MNVQHPEFVTIERNRLNYSARRVRIFVMLLIFLLGSLVTWAAVTNVDNDIEAWGTVQAKLENGLSNQPSTEFSGVVDGVFSSRGDKVEAGQLLVQLDTDEIQNEIRRQTHAVDKLRKNTEYLKRQTILENKAFQANVNHANAKIDEETESIQNDETDRQSRIKEAEAALAVAQSNFDRHFKLSTKGGNYAKEFDEALLVLDKAKEQLKRAQTPGNTKTLDTLGTELKKIKAEFELQQSNLTGNLSDVESDLESANELLSILNGRQKRAAIRAPCTGIVTQLDVHVGDWLEPGKINLKIAPDGFVFEARVPTKSRNLANLRIGIEALVSLEAFDRANHGMLKGKVIEVLPDTSTERGRPNETDAGNATGSYYLVRIELNETEIQDWIGDAPIGQGLEGKCYIKTCESRSPLNWLLGNFVNWNER